MTSVTSTCRDVAELNPVAQTAIRLFFQECAKAGINVFVTETYRSQARQDYLYAQGRSRSGKIVTWTRSSRHTNRLAWDIAVCTPNALYDTIALNKAGAIARKLGITWGGDWKSTPDKPHFEVTSAWRMPSGYRLQDGIVVPSTSKGRVIFTITDGKNNAILDGTKEVANVVLNETGRSAIRNIIKKAVEDKTFSSPHKDVDKYTDGELVSYLAAYIDRKIK